MDPLLRNAVVVGGLLLLVSAVGVLGRRAGAAAWIALAAAAICAVIFGVIGWRDLRILTVAVPLDMASRLGAWALLGVAVRSAGGPGLGRVPLLGAFIGGAAFGGPAAGLALADGRDPRSAARLVVSATAGGLCGPLGNEAALLLGMPGAALLPLGMALALVAAVGRPLARTPGGSRVLLVAAPITWATATFLDPDAGLVVGLVSAAAAAWMRRPPGPLPAPSRVAWALAVGGALGLLAPSGVTTWLGDALRWMPLTLGGLTTPVVGAGSLVASLVVGPVLPASAMRVATAADPSLLDANLHALVVAGAGTGGLLSVLVAAGPGVLRAGAGRLLLAVALTGTFIAFTAL